MIINIHIFNKDYDEKTKMLISEYNKLGIYINIYIWIILIIMR